LRDSRFKTAVVSASKNCEAVLRAARLADLFDAKVDGIDQERLGLKGKPAPDTFLEAARRLAVPPARMVIVEDALAGVAAARAGHYGLVIGISRGRPGPQEHGGRCPASLSGAVVDASASGEGPLSHSMH
jgi:beta-phosphoglucomutase-like phosphatase (HAD superfamily)